MILNIQTLGWGRIADQPLLLCALTSAVLQFVIRRIQVYALFVWRFRKFGIHLLLLRISVHVNLYEMMLTTSHSSQTSAFEQVLALIGGRSRLFHQFDLLWPSHDWVHPSWSRGSMALWRLVPSLSIPIWSIIIKMTNLFLILILIKFRQILISSFIKSILHSLPRHTALIIIRFTNFWLRFNNSLLNLFLLFEFTCSYTFSEPKINNRAFHMPAIILIYSICKHAARYFYGFVVHLERSKSRLIVQLRCFLLFGC